MTDDEHQLKEEAKETIDESIDHIDELRDDLHSVMDHLAELKLEGPETRDENNLEDEFKGELDRANDELQYVSQEIMEVMQKIHRLRQGKTPYFAPGTPEQDAAMAAISGSKASSRWANRYIDWPLNNFEDWEEVEPTREITDNRGMPMKKVVEVEGDKAWSIRGPQGQVYYLVRNMDGFDPV